MVSIDQPGQWIKYKPRGFELLLLVSSLYCSCPQGPSAPPPLLIFYWLSDQWKCLILEQEEISYFPISSTYDLDNSVYSVNTCGFPLHLSDCRISRGGGDTFTSDEGAGFRWKWLHAKRWQVMQMIINYNVQKIWYIWHCLYTCLCSSVVFSVQLSFTHPLNMSHETWHN